MIDLFHDLRRSGNRAFARALLRARPPASKEEEQYCLNVIKSAPGELDGLLAPLELITDIPDCPRILWAPLELGTERSTALRDDTEAATQRGLDEAWRVVGGQGPRPKRHVRSRLLEALVEAQHVEHVEQASLELPAFILGAAELGMPQRAGPPASSPWAVRAASGTFSGPLGGARVKLSAFEDLMRREPGARMLIAADRIESIYKAPRTTVVNNPKTAWTAAFWAPPHLAVRHFHLYTGDARQNLAAYASKKIPVDRVTAQNVCDIARDLLADLRKRGGQWRLTIGGPVGLWAVIGGLLRNKPDVSVRFEHHDVVWFGNQVGSMEGAYDGEAVDVPGVFVTKDASRGGPPGFATLPIPERMQPSELPRVVAFGLAHERRSTTKRFGIAVNGPGVVAAALAHELRASGRALEFHHYNNSDYEAWPIEPA